MPKLKVVKFGEGAVAVDVPSEATVRDAIRASGFDPHDLEAKGYRPRTRGSPRVTALDSPVTDEDILLVRDLKGG